MKIMELNLKIREKSLKRMEKRPARELAAIWSSEDLLYSGPGRAIFMVLPTPGCSWALSESGGCTMCSYVADSPLTKVSADEMIEIFRDKFLKQPISGPTAVKVFVSGSFLNPDEVPVKARHEILKTLNQYQDIEEIVVESRPQYITENVLRECCEAVPDKIFEVAIGLETGDEKLRSEIINKGFSNKEFENTIKIIKQLKKEFQVKSKVYLLVKPVLSSEKESIMDSVQSAHYAAKVGVDRISFCPSTIHKGTLMEELWRRGSYKSPWIWSILEIMKKTRKSLDIPVIMDTAGLGTRRGPYNCKKCNSHLKEIIIESNLNQSIPEKLDCECKIKWQADVEYSDLTRSNTSITKKA
jgi:radical SAM enzyme (TIGR01210 family)